MSAGALHMPRFLLSNIGNPADLRPLGIETVVALPGVDPNLQHPLGDLNYNLTGSDLYWKSEPALALISIDRLILRGLHLGYWRVAVELYREHRLTL